MKIRLFAIMVIALSTLLAACDPGGGGGGTAEKRKVVVASKNFTEAYLIGEMYALVLENAGVPVTRQMNLGSTAIAHEALLKGGADNGIDLYPEYTSTGLLVVLQQERIDDPQRVFDAVKKGYKEKFKVTWLDRSPMNDTQAMVTTQEVAGRLGLKTLEDLCAKAGEITLAARSEFQTRPDALPALQELYGGCQFKEIKVVESDLLYKALVNKDVDAAQADSTAGEISGYNLVLLEDPKGYGGPYNIAPVVRDDMLAIYPEIATALNNLSPKITGEEISALNWEVAGKGRDYTEVAKEWLTEQGLIK